MANYIRGSERTESLDRVFFRECNDSRVYLLQLRSREGKSARAWRKDCRLAHSIEQRQKRRAYRMYAVLGDTSQFTAEWAWNPNSKQTCATRRDNRNFRVCGLDNNTLDFTPRWHSVGGGEIYELNEKYKKDRHILDRYQQKRKKN